MSDQPGLFPSEIDDDYLLKHVNAVALMPVAGGRRISLLGRKIFNVLLHRAQGEGEREEYEARMHEVISGAAYNSNDTAPIRRILRELMSTTVEWQSPSNGEIETWDACNLLSGAGTTKDKRTGAVIVRWRYDTKVRSQLLGPDRYARLSLEAITQLTTHAAMALYEICARYVDNPGHKTAKQHWRWWRPVLTGVASDDSKAEYRFFKRDVLRKAVAEINASTNLEVKGPIEYKERDNRTIAEIQFEVRYRGHNESVSPRPLDGLVSTDLPALGRAINAGVRQLEVEELIRKHGSAAFSAAIDELEKRLRMPSDKVGAVDKPGGWLRAYMSRVAKQGTEHASTKSKAQPRVTQATLAEHRASWTEEWLTRQKEALRRRMHDLPEIMQQELLQSFADELEAAGQGQLLRRLRSSGWDHRLVRDAFIKFYGLRSIGDLWDKPTPEDVLSIAAELAASGVKARL